VAVAGLLLALVQVLHAADRAESAIGILVDVIPFVLMALAIAYAGYWLLSADMAPENAWIVTAWAIGGAVGFAAISALILTSLNVGSEPFSVFESGAAVTVDNVTAGMLAGFLIGLYDARSRDRPTELERQRDRVETFAHRAADVNNYGRALNECDTLGEVSSLCVEALASLVDLRDTAVVEGRGDVATIVDSTIVGVDNETVARLAMRAAEADTAVVESHTDDLPDDLPEGVDSVITILVAVTDNATIAIVSLNRGEAMSDETQSLLEMLVSHAGTALENIYRTSVSRRQEQTTTIELESLGDG
jgi:hypothetical protein